jgi:hypothetical protein
MVSVGWRPSLIDETFEALHLHDRLRFDPRGLRSTERDDLRRLATDLRQQLVHGTDQEQAEK